MGVDIFFAGDVVVSKYRDKPLVTKELSEIIKQCDMACCNFEAPLVREGQVRAEKVGPSLCQDVQTAILLKSAGFNLFTLANNHIMDYGAENLKYTMNTLDDMGVQHIGAGKNQSEAFKPCIVKKDDIVIGIISVAENGFGTSIARDISGYAWFGSDELEEQLAQLKESCSHIVIVCHGGAEKWKVPLPEYRKLYKKWIDAGAAAVIAHHPHVPQGWETYKDGVIFYSLGNFAFDKGAGIQDANTICVKLHFEMAERPEYKVIYTTFSEDGVGFSTNSENENSISECLGLLKSQQYIDEVEKQCLITYEKKYKTYYESVLNLYRGSLKRLLKTLYFRIIKRQKFSDVWLYHNLEIETHYWICRRALDLLQSEGRTR